MFSSVIRSLVRRLSLFLSIEFTSFFILKRRVWFQDSLPINASIYIYRGDLGYYANTCVLLISLICAQMSDALFFHDVSENV